MFNFRFARVAVAIATLVAVAHVSPSGAVEPAPGSNSVPNPTRAAEAPVPVKRTNGVGAPEPAATSRPGTAEALAESLKPQIAPPPEAPQPLPRPTHARGGLPRPNPFPPAETEAPGPRILAPAGGSWSLTTTGQSGVAFSNPLLLHDGSVLFHDAGAGDWWKLTPDLTGSYSNGTWTQTASLPTNYGPLYFASAVLADGRVIIEGGEYNFPTCSANEIWTNLGAIYDPNADAWTSVAPPSGPGWTNTFGCGTSANGGIGDAASIVLPSGTFLLSSCCASPPLDATLNETTLAWTAANAPDTTETPPSQNEQGYTLLQNGDVLTISVSSPDDVWSLNTSTGNWSQVAPTPVSLIDPVVCGNYEIGPAVTRADGTVVAFGGNTGCAAAPSALDPTAIYDPSANSWTVGPNVPTACNAANTLACDLADAPASWMPSGSVLFAASPGYGKTPTHFFEFSPENAIVQVSDPLYNAPGLGAYRYNFLQLPSGQTLVTDTSNQPELYAPVGSPNTSWPAIITVSPSFASPGNTYSLQGARFNGLSQGAAYGDDVQGATNYPMVQITNSISGHVFYATTSDYNTFSISPHVDQTTSFSLPAEVEQGPSTLSVVSNGALSVASVPINIQRSLYAHYPHFNKNDGTDLLWRAITGGTIDIWEMNGGTVNAVVGGEVLTNGWQIAAVGDFNGDGVTDIAFRYLDGTVAVWFFNPNGSGTVISAVNYGQVDNSWSIVGSGDFNGDGIDDLLWRNADGTVAIWLMNGASSPTLTQSYAVSNFWTIVGLGDFNDDGVSDILWLYVNNTQVPPDPTTAFWEFNKSGAVGAVIPGPALADGWNIVGTGDFNKDGTTDVLLSSTNGTLAIWFINNAAVSGVGGGEATNTDYAVAGVGDFNKDGYADVLFRYKDGTISIWEMQNGNVIAAVGGQKLPYAQWALVQ